MLSPVDPPYPPSWKPAHIASDWLAADGKLYPPNRVHRIETLWHAFDYFEKQIYLFLRDPKTYRAMQMIEPYEEPEETMDEDRVAEVNLSQLTGCFGCGCSRKAVGSAFRRLIHKEFVARVEPGRNHYLAIGRSAILESLQRRGIYWVTRTARVQFAQPFLVKDTKSVTIDLSPELYRRVELACEARGTDIASEIRCALEKQFAFGARATPLTQGALLARSSPITLD